MRTPMKKIFQAARVAGCLLLALLAAWPVLGQTRHTLTIRDGQVWVDEQLIPAEDLPGSLDVTNLQAQFEYVGDTVPMITLNGVAYLLEDGRLREATGGMPMPGQVTISLLPAMPPSETGRLYDVQMSAPPENSVLLMREHAQAMQRLQSDLAMLELPA